MAMHLNLDTNGRVYFAVTCDGCHRVFACYDEACYSLESLRNAAIFAGWDAAARPEHPHKCPRCLPDHRTSSERQGQPLSRKSGRPANRFAVRRH